ncbi:hypothetical protein [Salinarchaeum laminariae]|uniref:hypothetical protein n=1 Tax=Salinarchaeum laminariae TaxID=869888 RepID=UPI0020BEA6AF|nr:hypothetical protein [Salinarchaeum laminariae]
MTSEKTRVDFNAPAPLVERADAVADILDVSRTRLLIEALEDALAELTTDEEFRRQLQDAYYSDRIDFETVDAVLGREEAVRMKLLRASLDRSPPEPTLAGDLPTGKAFYEGEPATWAPEESAPTHDGQPDADG